MSFHCFETDSAFCKMWPKFQNPNSLLCWKNRHYLCCFFPTLLSPGPFCCSSRCSAKTWQCRRGNIHQWQRRAGSDLSSRLFTTAVELFVEVPDKPSRPFLQSEIGSSGMKLLSADESRCSETEGDSMQCNR